MIDDIRVLASQGRSIAEILPVIGISRATYYRKKKEGPAIREALIQGYDNIWGHASYHKVNCEYWDEVEAIGSSSREIRKTLRLNKLLAMRDRRLIYSKDLMQFCQREEYEEPIQLEPEKPAPAEPGRQKIIEESEPITNAVRSARMQNKEQNPARKFKPVNIPRLKRF